MSKQKTVVLKALPGFQPGHARMGGRGKHSIAEARALAAELGISPMAYLLNLLAVDATEEIEFAEDGTERRVKVPVTRELKISISQSLLNFFHPKLSSTAITGKDDGPVEVGVIDINAMMDNPALVAAAQTLSLAATANSRAIDAGPARGLPSPFNSNPLPPE
jgi:hypothetical protein